MTESTLSDEGETPIRDAWQRRDYSQAAGLVIEQYGGEILSFLLDRTRARSDADEIFSDFTENLLRGMPSLEWRTTARAWAYRIARNAAAEYFRHPVRRRERLVTLSNPEVARISETVRATTVAHLRTDVKNRFRELRLQLSEEDQTIFVLRVDRGLSWEEIATITLVADDASPAKIKLEAQRIRQRFKRAKEDLRQLALEVGLLDES